MAKMIAYCGLDCTGCDAFPTNQKKLTADEKIKTAEKWSAMYGHGHAFKPEDINCSGCTTKGKLNFSYCNVCEIRNCGQEKKVKNCAYCSDYACEKLEKFFIMAPMAKANLEEIKKR